MADAKEIDYRAELKATLEDFNQAAEKGNEAVKELKEGVTRLASLTLSALQGTQFEMQAELLAAQLAKAGVTVETLHNAPLKVTRTGGADIYKVVKVLEKAAAEEAKPPAKVGNSEAVKAEDRPELQVKEEPKSGRK
jgi:hypothetical protein